VRRRQNQWLRTTIEFENGVVPHKLECAWNEVYCWGRDGKQHLTVPDARDWSRYLLSTNGLHPYEHQGWCDEEWPPRWYERVRRK
jgi:hypothetical protein